MRDGSFGDTLSYDRLLLGLTFALCVFGLIMVTSASADLANQRYGDPYYFLHRQAGYLLLALIVGVLVYSFDCQVWIKNSAVILVAAMILLVLVLWLGNEVNGSKRWLLVEGVSVQPSEMAKLACIIFIAGYVARHTGDFNNILKPVLKPLIWITLVGLLLMMEPDYGATAIVFAVAMGMLFLGGINIWAFAGVLVSGVGSLALLAFIEPYRWERLTAFMDPWKEATESGYQLTQSLIAIGGSPWFGRGLGESVQKQFYLPEAHTDFIFSVIVEELGFIAVLTLIICYLIIVWRCFSIARRAREQEQIANSQLAYGIGILLGVQAFLNIAVAIGAVPTKGVPLPLISVGGSNLLVTCAALAMVQAVHREACKASAESVRRNHRSSRSA